VGNLTLRPFIISVTGAHSRVGKTTLCSILLKELKGFGAIKYTKTPKMTAEERGTKDERRRARDEKSPNTELLTPSLLIDDIGILNQKGKDTAIFLESSAERVFWIQSPYNELEHLLEIAISRMKGIKGVIIEGNSPVDFVTPSLIIFITGAEGEIKPSAVKVSKRADIVIINSKERIKRLPSLPMVSRKGKKVFWIDLMRKKGEIDEFLRFVKERINKDPH